MGPRSGNWDCNRVGAGGVPIETDHGWLVLYHGYDDEIVYRFGACLLDPDDVTRVLSRPAGYLMEPRETWELKGDVPRAIFSAANPVVDGTVYVYYGGADRVLGLATCDLNELLAFARSR